METLTLTKDGHMKSDRAKRAEATKREYKRVFDNMNSPSDIVAECSDGVWTRTCNQWIGGFAWARWTPPETVVRNPTISLGFTHTLLNK